MANLLLLAQPTSYQRSRPSHRRVNPSSRRSRWLRISIMSLFVSILVCWMLLLLAHWEELEDLFWHDHHDAKVSAFPLELYKKDSNLPCVPQRIHLAQRSNVESGRVSMTVSFMLDYQHEECADAQPTIIYGQGLDEDGSVKEMERLQFNYTSDKRQDLFESDWIFHAELPQLKAGLEHYWYRIITKRADNEPGLASSRRTLRANLLGQTPTYPFQTPPLPSTPTRMALVGDVGQTEDSTTTMYNVLKTTTSPHKQAVSSILIAGDMSYADSEPQRWISWFTLMEPLFRSIPLQVAAGNHEVECTTSGELFVPYEHYFYNPNRLQATDLRPHKMHAWTYCSAPSEFKAHYNYGNAFYSYQHGLAHVIVLSSYSETTVGSVQYQWLQQELEGYNRTVTPWLLVAFHAPLYTTFKGHVDEKEALTMKSSMEPLFAKFGVNFIVSGHDHAYMRTHPLLDGEVDPTGKAPIYLTVGAGGNRERHSSGYRHLEPEPWVAKRTLIDYGFLDLYMRITTHASLQWVRDGDEEGGIHDRTWIINPHID